MAMRASLGREGTGRRSPRATQEEAGATVAKRNGTSRHGRGHGHGSGGACERAREGVKPLRASPVDVYLTALAAAPLATRCATSGVLWGLSDVLAQKVQQSKKPGSVDQGISLKRVARYAFFGFVVHAPLFCAYYHLQDTLVDRLFSALVAPLIKLSVDQFVWTPFLFLPIFFGGMALLEGLTLKQAREEALEKGWGLTPTLKANWKFWFPVCAVNYSLMPVELRIVWINVCALVWNIYLSLVQNRSRQVTVDADA